ncbi:MAG: hypothetical protein JWM11_3445 [Planctomycetaceae bacterium]|nr:hypothetical protein [Planctomycetaceae bacterium]
MPMFLADIRLHRARLFFRKNAAGDCIVEPNPWSSSEGDLNAARRAGWHCQLGELSGTTGFASACATNSFFNLEEYFRSVHNSSALAKPVALEIVHFESDCDHRRSRPR